MPGCCSTGPPKYCRLFGLANGLAEFTVRMMCTRVRSMPAAASELSRWTIDCGLTGLCGPGSELPAPLQAVSAARVRPTAANFKDWCMLRSILLHDMG